METLAVKEDGRLMIGAGQFAVFKLANGKRAVSQSDVYFYFTGKRAKQGARYFLSLSNLRKHLPKKLLQKDQAQIIHNGSELLVFYADEWVNLCKAILHASFVDDLSDSWKAAAKRSQLLLMEFALNGVNVCINNAIKTSPLLSMERFDQVILDILKFKAVLVMANHRKKK